MQKRPLLAMTALYGGHLAVDLLSGGGHLAIDALLWVLVASGVLRALQHTVWGTRVGQWLRRWVHRHEHVPGANCMPDADQH